MEKPYIKRLDQVEEFTVWQVDGKYIRDHMNREFTNFAQHYRFPFIPKYEFWIDVENGEQELEYFIEHLTTEWHHCDQGEDYDTALAKADRREKAARKKSAVIQKVLAEKEKHPKQVPKEVYKDIYMKLGDDTKVWIVRGSVVRGAYFIDFTEGGHHYVYPFVPEDEVWLDDDLVDAERDYVLLHEVHERELMKTGMHYYKAHASSSAIEYKARRNPKELGALIEKEISRVSSIV